MRPVVLIVRDGWGINENPKGNAVAAASTPIIDRLKKEYPWTKIDCSGEAVGLPNGYQGSSEVGHMNMGAGRVVIQELKRIDDGLSSGELFKAEKWSELISNWKTKQGRLHLFGLLQDEGVHAHQEHLFKIMKRARKDHPDGQIIVHPFLDGRDTPPKSTLQYISKLTKIMQEVGNCVIGSFMGRYYGMDRSKNWDLTDKAYHCIVCAEGRKTDDMVKAIESSYDNDKTPDNLDMCDEYIPPHCMSDFTGIQDGDVIMHTNYRQDRASQLTMAFVDPNYPGSLKKKPEVTYLGFTRYYDEFTEYLMGPLSSGGGMNNLLGEVISKNGLRQLRIAETQKFPHVTSFFNGKSTTPFKNEDQVRVDGRFDPATFASHPEMEAYRVTEEVLKRLENNPYAFVAINFANGDMVGHTGSLPAATKAVEVVDECIGTLMKRFEELDAKVLITADHGNSEQLIDYDTGLPKTSHTMNLVELIYVASDAKGAELPAQGKLSDIAPTILHLMNIEIPKEMTADNLLAGN